MPVKSYLAHAFEGEKDALVFALAKLPACEYYVAENEDIVVVVTDTPDEQEENILYDTLVGLPALKNLSLVSGFMNQA